MIRCRVIDLIVGYVSRDVVVGWGRVLGRKV